MVGVALCRLLCGGLVQLASSASKLKTTRAAVFAWVTVVGAGMFVPLPAFAGSCRTAIYMLQNEIPRARAPDAKSIDPVRLNEWLCVVRALDTNNPISLTGIPVAQRPAVIEQARNLLIKTQRALEAFAIRPGGMQGETEFTAVTFAAFRQAVAEATLELFGRLAATETAVYFVFGDTLGGNSGRWVFHLMVDSLRDRPDLLAKIKIIEGNDLRGVDPATVQRIVLIDDASYSGTQASAMLYRQIQRLPGLQHVDVLIPFMTTNARALIENDITEGNTERAPTAQVQVRFPARVQQAAGRIRTLNDIYTAWQALPPAQRPLLDRQNMRDIFGDDWETLTLTFFDHKVADEVSLVSFLSSSSFRPIVAGPVPAIQYLSRGTGFRLVVGMRRTEPNLLPFVLNYSTTPYPNQADLDLIQGGLFR